MKITLSRMIDAIEKRAQYRATVEEIRKMPLEVAHDLDIDPANAELIAEQAVYGGDAHAA